MTTELALSQPRQSAGVWVVDVIRASDERAMAEIALTPELVPPRLNARGKVVWALPSDPSVAPRLGLNEQKAVLASYKKLRKEKKDTNRAAAQVRKREDVKRDKAERWGARTIQSAWRGRQARRHCEALRRESRDPSTASIDRASESTADDPGKLPSSVAAILAAVGRSCSGDKERWIATWKSCLADRIDDLAEAAWRQAHGEPPRALEFLRSQSLFAEPNPDLQGPPGIVPAARPPPGLVKGPPGPPPGFVGISAGGPTAPSPPPPMLFGPFAGFGIHPRALDDQRATGRLAVPSPRDLAVATPFGP